MKYKVVILEDDVFFQIRLEEMLQNSSFELISTFSHPQGLYEFLSNLGPCILICDLIIDGKPKGLEFIQNLDLPHVAVVAITMTPENDLFMKILKRSIPFVVKPFHQFTLLSALQNVAALVDIENSYRSNKGHYLFLSNKTKDKEKIWIKDIVYLETQGNYMTYHCIDQRKFVEKTSMKLFLSKQNHPDFIQIHKNFSVNSKHIVKVDSDHVFLVHSVVLPLSKTFRRALIDCLKSL